MNDEIIAMSFEQYSQMVEAQTGEKLDLITIACASNWWTKETLRQIANGVIPVWIKFGEGQKTIEGIVPSIPAELLMQLWGNLTSMTDSEKRQKISESGLYPDFGQTT